METPPQLTLDDLKETINKFAVDVRAFMERTETELWSNLTEDEREDMDSKLADIRAGNSDIVRQYIPLHVVSGTTCSELTVLIECISTALKTERPNDDFFTDLKSLHKKLMNRLAIIEASTARQKTLLRGRRLLSIG